MRAHFADSTPASPDSIDEIRTEPTEARIEEFKQDPKNMAVLAEFIDDVLVKAEVEASKQQSEQEEQQKSQQAKEKTRQSFTIPDFKNGKVVNRARGFVVRIFDAICHCANNAAAAPTARFKLRTGKRQQTEDDEEPKQESLMLNKPDKDKQQSKNGKEKKSKDEIENKPKTKGVRVIDEAETFEMLND